MRRFAQARAGSRLGIAIAVSILAVSLAGYLFSEQLRYVSSSVLNAGAQAGVPQQAGGGGAQGNDTAPPAAASDAADSSAKGATSSKPAVPFESLVGSMHEGPLDVTPLPAFVTFIIPSVGRATLNQTLHSLLNQTLPESWLAIIILDGKPDNPLPAATIKDHRVRTVTTDYRMTSHNGAGKLRNIAMKLARTPWVAMVDDDDTLHPQYVERLLYEVQHSPEAEVVLQRMVQVGAPRPVPGVGTKQMFIGAGISFAVRRLVVLEGFVFVPGGTEDGEFLLKFEKAGRPLLISPFVSYFVKCLPHMPEEDKRNEWEGLERVRINF